MSTTPPTEPTAEHLEQDGGTAAPRGRAGGRRRSLLLGVGSVAVLGLVGTGAWAATGLLGTGEQPAEVLPAATLGYVSLDLDPSGAQKIAALRTLNKFPALSDTVDFDAPDDLVRDLGESLLAETGCDVDFAAVVEPWLGSRFALAAVDTGAEEPSPVAVVQVSDAAAAEDGLTALSACGSEEEAGWAVEGGWAVLAESAAVAEQVLADAGDAALADDADFQRWTAEAGDAGVLSGYAAPEAGGYLAAAMRSDAAHDVEADLAAAWEDFGGAAMTVRFTDGGLEVETASGTAGGALAWPGEGDQGAAAMSSLPADTALALGLGLDPGWVTELLDRLEAASGDETDVRAALEDALAGTGLVPADLEALLGTSAVLSVGDGLDVAALGGAPLAGNLPVALSVEGDPAEVERVLDAVREAAGPEAASVLASQAEGDTVVVGPDPVYREDVLGSDGLGTSERFTEVLPDAEDAAVVLYVDVDAFDTLLDQVGAGAGAGAGDVLAGVRVLSALGASSWVDGDVSRSRLVVTTDD